MTTSKIYGAPGTGKTTRLLDILSQELEETHPSRIAYITHTVSANREAVERAMAKLGDFSTGKVYSENKDFIYFKTIHAICFFELGLARQSVMQPEDYLKFGKSIGIPFSRFNTREIDVDGLPMGYAGSRGNVILNAYFFAKSNRIPVSSTQGMWPIDMRPSEAREIVQAYDKYKLDTGMIDFSDMLELYLSLGEPIPIDVLIIDEAQDLSKQQWEVVSKFQTHAKHIYIAGDDDQSIYSFLGADPTGFLDHPADQIEVLPITYRLKENVWAKAEKIITKVSNRQHKDIEPIHELASIADYPHGSLPVDYQEDTLLIAPHNRQIMFIGKRLEELGIPYSSKRSYYHDQIEHVLTWFRLRDGEAISTRSAANLLKHMGMNGESADMRSLYRNDPTSLVLGNQTGIDFDKPWVQSLGTSIGHRQKNQIIANIIKANGIEALTSKPKIRLSTYHGSKGLEADHVILITDCYEKAWKHFQDNPDDERRLSYVGVTRAKNKLSVIRPESHMCMRSLC